MHYTKDNWCHSIQFWIFIDACYAETYITFHLYKPFELLWWTTIEWLYVLIDKLIRGDQIFNRNLTSAVQSIWKISNDIPIQSTFVLFLYLYILRNYFFGYLEILINVKYEKPKFYFYIIINQKVYC